MGDLANRLSQFDGQYEAAVAPEGGQKADLPEGKYQTTCEGGEAFEAKTTGRLYLKIAFCVMDGPMKGSSAVKLYALDDPEKFGFLKKDLLNLGIGITKLSELEDALPKLRGIEQSVTAKKSKDGQFTNYWLNGRPTPVSTSDGSDIPF
jgi:hypothetical protein